MKIQLNWVKGKNGRRFKESDHRLIRNFAFYKRQKKWSTNRGETLDICAGNGNSWSGNIYESGLEGTIVETKFLRK